MMTLLLNVSATLLFALTALLGRGPGNGFGNGNGSGNGNGGPSGTPCAACQVADPAATPLSATEKESLLYMREERSWPAMSTTPSTTATACASSATSPPANRPT